MRVFIILGAVALLAAGCATKHSPPPAGHGGICATQPQSQKCVDGVIGKVS